MPEKPPVIDLSSIWNRLEHKEVVPFFRDMVIPTETGTTRADKPNNRKLICQIQIFDAVCLEIENPASSPHE